MSQQVLRDSNHGFMGNAEAIADELVRARPKPARRHQYAGLFRNRLRLKYSDCAYVSFGVGTRVRKLSATEVAEFKAAVQRVIDR